LFVLTRGNMPEPRMSFYSYDIYNARDVFNSFPLLTMLDCFD